MSRPDAHPALCLEFIGELYRDPFPIEDGSVITIGRAAESTIVLLAEPVSRRHASVSRRGGAAYLTDLGSTLGTTLNSLRVEPAKPAPLAPGDIIQIGPFTLRVALAGARGHSAHSSTARLGDEPPTFSVQTLDSVSPHAGRRLRSLTECIARLNASASVEEAAEIVMRQALGASGYARAAILRRTRDDEVEIIASSRADAADAGPFSFSRSLILAAAAGSTAVLTPSQHRISSHSLAGLHIHSALCAPVRVGSTIAAYLYVDARNDEAPADPDAAAFCDALATAIGLAFANLARADLERRQSALASELTAAHEAQQFILPEPDAALGFLRYGMRMRPGAFVAGDLFDVVPLGDGRTAITIGDVAGHGVASGLLMASAQAHLHAQLQTYRSPGPALAAVNRYLCARNLAGRFITLWLGVFSEDGRLEYVDAGHGHWALHRAGDAGLSTPADAGRTDTTGPIPLGISQDADYSSCCLSLSPGDRVLLYTDGVIEQKSATGEQFGVDRLAPLLTARLAPGALVDHVINELVRFSGDGDLEDDATVACIGFGPSS